MLETIKFIESSEKSKHISSDSVKNVKQKYRNFILGALSLTALLGGSVDEMKSKAQETSGETNAKETIHLTVPSGNNTPNTFTLDLHQPLCDEYTSRYMILHRSLGSAHESRDILNYRIVVYRSYILDAFGGEIPALSQLDHISDLRLKRLILQYRQMQDELEYLDRSISELELELERM